MTKAKVKELKNDFRGITLTNYATRGKEFENILASKGHPVNPGIGPDYPEFDLEVKTKDVNSTSANSIGTLSYEEIIKTPYRKSPIAKKLQQQFRVSFKNGVAVSQKIYDFSPSFIQEVLETAYEAARSKMINGNKEPYVYGSNFGYFEQKRMKGGKLTNSWAFRISVGAMEKLENMSTTTFKNLFK